MKSKLSDRADYVKRILEWGPCTAEGIARRLAEVEGKPVTINMVRNSITELRQRYTINTEGSYPNYEYKLYFNNVTSDEEAHRYAHRNEGLT